MQNDITYLGKVIKVDSDIVEVQIYLLLVLLLMGKSIN